ncbi:MAG: hypothetical protein H6667_25380 [Ardenticatenaceae bacterium]|nr:hypothetical protein [Ardenticatenaceae bacterium]MCB9445962.1 hypothetical protein [Ardenticatenaceae bacterium]
MNKKVSTALIIVGFFFLLNTIFGRYIVLPGYLAGLEQGAGTLEGAGQVASGWEIARYLLWAYSFKLGIYFLMLGMMFRTEMSAAGKWVIGVGGFVYIAFAYIPLPNPTSIVFGLAGGLMMVLMVFVVWRWGNGRSSLHPLQQTASDYRLAGCFFFAMATYTLCPLLGVKTFALSPEKMIAYGLQGEAASFAFHLVIELLLGWIFLALSFHHEKNL